MAPPCWRAGRGHRRHGRRQGHRGDGVDLVAEALAAPRGAAWACGHALSQPAAGDAARGAPPRRAAPSVLPPAPSVVNLANALTVLRLLLVPVFVVFLVAGGTGARITALAGLPGRAATDLLDGRIARRRGLITDFGKIADPIADKALTGAALVTLSALGELAWWVTAVILARELAVTGLRFWVHPARGDRGQPGRQAEDAAAGAGHRAVRAARAAGAAPRGGDGAAVAVTVVTGSTTRPRGPPAPPQPGGRHRAGRRWPVTVPGGGPPRPAVADGAAGGGRADRARAARRRRRVADRRAAGRRPRHRPRRLGGVPGRSSPTPPTSRPACWAWTRPCWRPRRGLRRDRAAWPRGCGTAGRHVRRGDHRGGRARSGGRKAGRHGAHRSYPGGQQPGHQADWPA